MTSTRRPADELFAGLILTQLFRAEADFLSAVTVTLATWGRRPEGEGELRLSREPHDLKPRLARGRSVFGSRQRSYYHALKTQDGNPLSI